LYKLCEVNFTILQKEHKVYIKGMVCQRCISTIKDQLEKLGLYPDAIGLGEIIFSTRSNNLEISRLEDMLKPLGFTLLEDKKGKLVKETKALVAEVYGGDFDFPVRFRFSDLAAKRLQKDYDSVSAAFSTMENITVEKYIIEFRIEKIKEFLVYTPLTLGDISFRLGFSSVAHLSRQFKECTGLNPSHFRQLRNIRFALKNERKVV
jgi:AraC family transcriptional regulator